MTNSDDSDAPIVRCRAKSDAWAGVALFGFMGCMALNLLWLKPEHPSPNCPPVPKCAGGWTDAQDLMFVGGLALSLWSMALMCYLSIRFDETVAAVNGLAMRTFWRKRFYLWPEITDFYIKSMNWRYIEINGKPLALPREQKNLSQLYEAVAHYATNAKAHEWGMLGARDVDEWQRTFEYDRRKIKFDKRFGISACVAMPLALIGVFQTGSS